MSLKTGPKRTTDQSEKEVQDKRQKVDGGNKETVKKHVPPLEKKKGS